MIQDEIIRPVTILWINFTGTRTQQPTALFTEMARRHLMARTVDIEYLGNAIQHHSPCILVFDFDYPSTSELALLQTTKLAYPHHPILMLTRYHSEALAVWALRARVWDYLTKPVQEKELLDRIMTLTGLLQANLGNPSRSCATPEVQNESATLNLGTSRHQQLVQIAKDYVYRHIRENIDERIVAQHCNVSYHHFSRIFKQMQGQSFSSFVLELRIKKAAELFEQSDISVTNVCYETGFNDVSYFTRAFRRHLGVNPSVYREQQIKQRKEKVVWLSVG